MPFISTTNILTENGFDSNFRREDSNVWRTENPDLFEYQTLAEISQIVPEGGIDMNKLNPIHYGQTDYDTGVGFWLGVKNGLAYFSVGDSSGNKITWNGLTSTLGITGGIDISSKLDKLGGAYNSAASGARVQILPDSNTGIRSYDSGGNVVFLQVVGGTDVGDVSMGREDLGQYAKWDASSQKFLVNGLDVSVGNFGGTGEDGILNLTSGTTNIASGTHQYSSITIASGAVLSTASSSGTMILLCQRDMTVTGSINISDKLISTSPESTFTTRLGATFTPTGCASVGHGAGGGGGDAIYNGGGDGGNGNGGGAGGNGYNAGYGGGQGGASTGGGVTQGAGGYAGEPPANGGNSAGGGGAGANSGGGGGNPGGNQSGIFGQPGGDGFGAKGGDGSAGHGGDYAGGGGAGGQGGLYGGMDLFINVGGSFIGTSGIVDLSGSDGIKGGDGGAFGGGGGGGGKGATGGSLRLIYGNSYSASTYTLSGGAGGAKGNAGSSGNDGYDGPAGTNGSQVISKITNIY